MNKHTPGPWWFDHDWNRLPTIFAPDRKTKIAIVEKVSGNKKTPEQEANARLIEAVPNLLSALRQIADGDQMEIDFVMRGEFENLCEYQRELARAAITAAVGDPAHAPTSAAGA